MIAMVHLADPPSSSDCGRPVRCLLVRSRAITRRSSHGSCRRGSPDCPCRTGVGIAAAWAGSRPVRVGRRRPRRPLRPMVAGWVDDRCQDVGELGADDQQPLGVGLGRGDLQQRDDFGAGRRCVQDQAVVAEFGELVDADPGVAQRLDCKAVEQLTIEAARSRSASLALKASAPHPLVDSVSTARVLLKGYRDRHPDLAQLLR